MSLTPAMRQMLREMTPAQLDTMIRTANQPRPSVELPTTTVSGGKGKKKLARSAPSGKATRPLNSWIAFRSYYATAFPKYQQKDISGFLNKLWQSDPFKAKWSLLAKSYSVIRDSQGKENIHLDQFLAVTGPLIGVIKPERYLQAMGWEIAIQENGQAVMMRVKIDLDERHFVNNLSVNDIIRHCYQQGFFTGNLAELLSSENEVVLTMATSAQRRTISQLPITNVAQVPGTRVVVVAASDEVHDEANKTNDQDLAAESTEDNKLDNKYHGTAEKVPQMSSASDIVDAPNVVIEDTITTGTSPAYMGANTAIHLASSIDTLFSDARLQVNENTEVMQQPIANYAAMNPASELSAGNFQTTSNYPFNTEFDPEFLGFVFNPFLGNQFDVFDMSDLGWMDIINFNACA